MVPRDDRRQRAAEDHPNLREQTGEERGGAEESQIRLAEAESGQHDAVEPGDVAVEGEVQTLWDHEAEHLSIDREPQGGADLAQREEAPEDA